MSSFIIEGGRRLSGEIVPQGAKNEALQVISATLLTSREVLIDNVPEISDVKNLIELLRMMGVKVERHARGSYSFCASDIDTDYVLSADFVRRCAALRGSVLVVGPILGRFGKAYFPKPGGDKIGRGRPVPVDGLEFIKVQKPGIRQFFDVSDSAHCGRLLKSIISYYIIIKSKKQ